MKTMNTEAKHGYALVTVMGLMAVLAITFTMLYNGSKQSIHMGEILGDRTRATAYAEAGVEYAYAILRDDYTKRTALSNFQEINGSSIISNTVQTTYGEGTYTLSLTSISNQYVIINSIGECGNSTVEVEAVCENTTAISDDDDSNSGLSGFDFSVYGGGSGSEHRIGGGTWAGVTSDTGNMHFNDSLNNSGNTAISGNVSTTGNVTTPGKISGTIAPNQTTVRFPALEEKYESFDDYKEMAERKHTGDFSASGTYDVGGNGILYVDGNVSIKGTFNGTIIATGSVTIQGEVKAGPTGIAVATPDGKIQLNTKKSNTCEGLFYTGGDFQQTAQGTLDGQIVVGGHFKSTGGSDIYLNGGGTTEPDDPTPEPDPNPVIAAWQK